MRGTECCCGPAEDLGASGRMIKTTVVVSTITREHCALETTGDGRRISFGK